MKINIIDNSINDKLFMYKDYYGNTHFVYPCHKELIDEQ